jgi:RimJ/RimL family protein N-acetyltransferase
LLGIALMTPDHSQQVRLRSVQETDAAHHAAWPPEAEIVRMYGGEISRAPQPDLDRSKAWVAWMQDHPFAAMIECNGQTVGHVRLHSLSEADRRARLAIGLFATQFLGKGIGRRAIALTLDHAFGPMGLHRVDLRVLAYNTRAIRCYKACGFAHEGTERQAARIAGEWHDDLIMGILSHEHTPPRT